MGSELLLQRVPELGLVLSIPLRALRFRPRARQKLGQQLFDRKAVGPVRATVGRDAAGVEPLSAEETGGSDDGSEQRCGRLLSDECRFRLKRKTLFVASGRASALRGRDEIAPDDCADFADADGKGALFEQNGRDFRFRA
ncbi:hypothetical protein MHBO_003465 [Bonamia ostreae]|uniref:Uncharacterized protein n=1 Tax=Bonamia ostreae TaxID=126728 RepID=A0ABV2ARA5_9EUKA